MSAKPFWQVKSFQEMTIQEWESLCDGCARCCLQKLEDEASGERVYTRIACRYLDQESCRCSDYSQRTTLVPQCRQLTPENVYQIDWLPETCAYRLLAEGKNLADWHPLVTKEPNSVHNAGISVRGKVLSEQFVHPEGYEEHIITWVK